VFEKRVLGRIFGPKKEEAAGGWVRLHNEELNNLYSSPDIIKEDEMGGTCSSHGRGEICIHYFGWETWKRSVGRRNISEKILLKWILEKQGGFNWLMAGSCELENELSGFIKQEVS
jgi:hypothetical protein